MSNSGMAGGLSTRDFKQQLRYLPTPNKTLTVDFPRLDGGLNIYDLDYRLNPNESPDMKNLRWKDGALGSRYGQDWVIEPTEGETGYAAHDDLFWGYAFVHIDSELRCFDPAATSPAYTVLLTGVPTVRGTFFRYGDNLMYKTRGGYYQIGYNPSGATVAAMFPVKSSATEAYVPVTYINANPATVAGDAYQPENRLSREKTIWYSAEANVTDYYLPYGAEGNHTDAVTRVEVDGTVLTSGYTVHINDTGYEGKACVVFDTAPAVPSPFVPNTVRITYRSAGTDAYNSVMSCPYATVYGGDQNLCVVLGGCAAQPNAYFWNGNDDLAMNPWYFPMEHYNFAGDTESAIMGFGKQQGFLVVFSKKGVGKASFGTTTTGSDRLQIEMPYTAINSRIGCDYPWSIQLVDNNLVFCSLEHGVCLLTDSSAAHENNIMELSRKVNGNDKRHGMMFDTATAGEGAVYSTIYEDKLWLVANEHAYVWDFRLSDYNDPVWFYYTNIKGVAFIRHADELWHLSANGGASGFLRGLFADYGEPIEKVYQFATQMMGGYDRLKNVTSVIFVVRSDTNTSTDIEYITDYEKRYDLTPIRSFNWSLVPLDLRYSYLGVIRFADVQRRAPMCRHVRHFTMRLENNVAYHDLGVVSAQMQFNYQGRQR